MGDDRPRRPRTASCARKAQLAPASPTAAYTRLASTHRAAPPLPSSPPPLHPPRAAILKNRAVFPDDPEKQLDTWTPRLTYCLIHGLGIAFAVWKINGMGLLPTHLSDWVSSMRPPAAAEHAAASLL